MMIRQRGQWPSQQVSDREVFFSLNRVTKPQHQRGLEDDYADRFFQIPITLL